MSATPRLAAVILAVFVVSSVHAQTAEAYRRYISGCDATFPKGFVAEARYDSVRCRFKDDAEADKSAPVTMTLERELPAGRYLLALYGTTWSPERAAVNLEVTLGEMTQKAITTKTKNFTPAFTFDVPKPWRTFSVAVRSGGVYVRFYWFYVTNRLSDAGWNRADNEFRIEEDLIRAETSGVLPTAEDSPEPANWLHNGSFEVGLPLNQWSTAYQSSQTIAPRALDATQPADGLHCLRMKLFNIAQVEDAPSRLLLISRVTKLKPDKTYWFRGMFRSDTPATVNVTATTAYGASVRLGAGRLQTGPEWKPLDVQVRTNDDPRGIHLHLTADAPRAATLWMDGFVLAEKRPSGFVASAPVEIGVQWEPAGKIFHAEEPATFTLLARNYSADDAAKVVVRRRVVDYFDRVLVEETLPFDLPPAQTASKPFDAGTGRTGNFRLLLDGTATTPAGTVALPLQEYVFCVVPTPPTAMRGTLGAYITLAPDPIAAMSRAGIRRTVTLSCANGLLEEWRRIEPEPGRFVWWDPAIALAEKHGVAILGNIHSDFPKWAMNPQDPADALRFKGGTFSRAAWTNFFENLTAHYKAGIRDWLIIDEPYSSFKVEEYSDLLKATYSAAKRGNPDCRVLAHGGYTQEWIDGLVKNGALDSFDGVSDYARTEEQGKRLRKFRDATGKFIINVEYGAHMSMYRTIEAPDNPRDRTSPTCYTLNTEAVVADALRAMCWSGAVGFNRYDARFPGGDFTKLDRHKCLFEYDGALKPPAVAYAIAAQLLDGFGGVDHLALHPDIAALHLESDTRFALALIARAGKVFEATLPLPPDVTARDIMGNPLAPAPDTVVLHSGVTYILGPKARFEAAKTMISGLTTRPPVRIEAATRTDGPNGQRLLIVRITNLTQKPLQGMADLSPRMGVLRNVWAGPQPMSALAPGKAAEISFGLNAYAGDKPAARDIEALFTFDGITARETVRNVFGAPAPQ